MDYPWGPLINTLKHPIIPYIIPLITRLLDNYVLYAIIHYPRYDHIKIQILGPMPIRDYHNPNIYNCDIIFVDYLL